MLFVYSNFVSFYHTECGVAIHQKSNGALSSTLAMLYDVWQHRAKIVTKQKERKERHLDIMTMTAAACRAAAIKIIH